MNISIVLTSVLTTIIILVILEPLKSFIQWHMSRYIFEFHCWILDHSFKEYRFNFEKLYLNWFGIDDKYKEAFKSGIIWGTIKNTDKYPFGEMNNELKYYPYFNIYENIKFKNDLINFLKLFLSFIIILLIVINFLITIDKYLVV